MPELPEIILTEKAPQSFLRRKGGEFSFGLLALRHAPPIPSTFGTMPAVWSYLLATTICPAAQQSVLNTTASYLGFG